MPLRRWLEQSTVLPGAGDLRRVALNAENWRACATDAAAAGARLLAFWADATPRAAVSAALHVGQSMLVLSLELSGSSPEYPGLADLFPAAARMQRAAADLCGVRAQDADRRPWLRHAAWPAEFLPLAEGSAPPPPHRPLDAYEFVRVTGEGVHEIAVGPVHAGTIEPGHFRFSVVGEKVLRLEERLGYTHKGIERLFRQLPARDGQRLAARVCGDSTVAFSWAYCQACESIAATNIPPRAQWLRAAGLEAERIANHLGDLGALGNDAGFAFGLAQFSRLKERWLRATARAFGRRYLFDYVVPGGVAADSTPAALGELAACATEIDVAARELRTIYDEHAGVRDRFAGAGRVAPELALRLGLCGLAGRASGQAFDLRVDLPSSPYEALAVRKASSEEGDVMARVAVRFEELGESLRLIGEIARRIPAGSVLDGVPAPAAGFGIGLVEGWRGPVVVALSTCADGGILRCHPHDPSWQNWPVLEHAIIGNIVPDFPLINKSFNLAYSGHDL
ncbi:MAG TPA: NADH-quinone oxidoreductase subunit C [Steroidobacteraceae bacterium]|nr:NADH-quinone oxidoreductase subunit C [Steroidobacteraceae bacterium]